MNWPRPRVSLAIARTEYRRSVRAIAGSTTRLLQFGFLGFLFVGLVTVGGGYLVLRFGPQILSAVSVLSGARGLLALAWLGPVIVLAQRAIGKTGRIEHEAGMLTTVPAADVTGGLLLAEAARVVSAVAIPILVIAAAFAVGVGAPAAFVTIVVAVAGVLTLALLAGHIVGVAIKILFGQSELLTRYKSVIAVLAFVVYLAVIFSNAINRLIARLFVVLQASPMAWFGDLLALGIPGTTPSLVRVAGALAIVVVGIPALVALDVRATRRLWYADRAQPSARRHESSGSNAAFLAGIASGPTRAVTAKVWRRTLRSPLRLIYVMYPLFFLISPLQQAASSGTIPSSLPVLVSLCGAWVVGATTLNPFGDEGALLPVTLTSSIRGGEFVRGHVLAVAPVGLPVVVAVTAVTGFLSPLGPANWLPLALVSALLTVLGPVVALAVGSAFPRFGTVQVTRSRETVIPSKTAFVVYTLFLVLGFVGAVVALVPGGASVLAIFVELVATLLGLSLQVSPEPLRFVGGAVALVLAVVVPPLAYRYVGSRFESYTLG